LGEYRVRKRETKNIWVMVIIRSVLRIFGISAYHVVTVHNNDE
jgi:hypothetical protein